MHHKRRELVYWLGCLGISLTLFSGCQANATEAALLPTVQATAVLPSPATPFTPIARPLHLPPTFTPLAGVYDPTPTPTPTPNSPRPPATNTPDPYAALTIAGLSHRSYGAGQLEIIETLAAPTDFTRYLIRYPSDGLTTYGFMNVPNEQPPLATVLVLHGYIEPDTYQIQTYTTPYADALAQAGFLVIHPNYRNHPPSDTGDNPFRIGYAVDVLNLITLIRQQAGQAGPLAQADPNNIHLFGHSMGGGISLRVITVDTGIKTAVLYGAMSGDERLNFERIAAWSRVDATSWELVTPDEDLARISPINHLERIETAVSIHHGTADTVVPAAWSDDLCQRLTALNKAVTCYTYTGQPHNFTGRANQQLIERAITQFTTTP